MAHQEIGRHWRSILDTLGDGVAIIDPGGEVLMVNQAMCRLTGYEAHELVGRPCTVFNCDACARSRRSQRGGWCELFSGEQPENQEISCRLIRKDGTYLPALKVAALLRDADGELLGAVETVTDLTAISRRDQRINELSHQLADEEDFMGMVGQSPAMRRVYHLIEKAAQGHIPVLIHGESGTGKELVARAIHDLGERREGPYVVFNCAALSESLFESELFGHVKGAFTGAHRHRVGRLETAHGGDFFMDEIGELPVSCQVKLLRVLEEKHIERVGDQRGLFVDVRFIAATNRDLGGMLRAGQFREDLYFRLNVIPIHLPPLRERREDLPALVEHFLARLRRRTAKDISGVSRQVMERFTAYHWPGNVRELRTALEYAFVLADHGLIELEQLPPHLQGRAAPPASAAPAPSFAPLRPSDSPEDERQRRELVEALKAAGGNQSRAAKLLGVSRATVYNRMNRLGVELKKSVRD
ncbi:sigma-54 interaction domain-containing protein [Desulfoferula mesophila]|uniref:Sigma-54-dependent Fis family transcriptional regulator n=1 Tax=Desulfoferula mesophila TaxID=3058419 RepID=A0AAU9EUX7_9BACT|nr:sigma-54-dependent Fis family transcriptional regulator [Desulfoferula mesophilus]